MSIEEKQKQIIEDFELLDDWELKYEHIIELGKSLPQIEDKKKTESNLIEGCQSKVWLDSVLKENKLYFFADSDAIITKGIIALLIDVFNGQSPEDILNSEVYFINQIGLQEHLSPTRANGLLSMVKKIKMEAIKNATVN
ncbi:MAG: SufE family protein [Flavobacteriia bacterium]|nr:SufE family protein [Flavobacteriia bacterium]